MGKINCICDIKDQDFKTSFSVLLLSSGFFNLKDAERIINEDEEKALEKTIYISETEDVPKEISNCFRVILSAEKGQANGNESFGKTIKIYRYEDFRSVLKRIGEVFDLFSVKKRVGDGESISVLAITSISGGAGTTTLAKAIGKIMSREGEQPLYLSLSPVNPMDESGDMIRVIYDLKRRREKDLSLYVSNFENLDEIGAPLVNSYINLIDKGAMEKIIKSAERAGYSLLILDMGNHLTSENYEILGLCDREIMVLPMRAILSGISREKITRILNYSACKSYTVINDNLGYGSEGKHYSLLEENPFGELAFIPYQRSMDERSLDGEYGNTIRFILEKIDECEEEKTGFN